MSTSKILSYMFFFVWRLVPRTRAGFRKLPKSFKEIPISSSGSAAVTERKYSRVPPSLVRYSTSCWGSFSAISWPIVAFKAACFCIFQDVPITRSSSGFIVMFLACVSFCFLGLSACLSFLLLSFRFNFCSFCFLFCFLGCSLRFLAFLGVAWLVLACLGFSWFFLALLGVSVLLSLLLCWLSCLFCFLAFWYWYTIVQSTLPAPGRGGLPNLPIFGFSCLICFLGCSWLFLAFSWRFLGFSWLVFSFPGFPYLRLAFLGVSWLFCCLISHSLAYFYHPVVVPRRSGSSIASFDKLSAAWLYSRHMWTIRQM